MPNKATTACMYIGGDKIKEEYGNILGGGPYVDEIMVQMQFA